MGTEFDYDLTHRQWEVLKALRLAGLESGTLDQSVIDGLVALALAGIAEGYPVLTPAGRKVLVRGSSRLWDVAA